MEASIAIGFVIALLILKLIITSSISAVINASKTILRELAEEGQRKAERALALNEAARNLLATQQFISMVTNTGIIVVVATQILPLIESTVDNGIGSILLAYILPLLILIATLVISDRLPTGLVIGRAEGIATFSSGYLTVLVKWLQPFVNALLRISGRIAALLGGSDVVHLVTEEEIKTLVDAGSEEGVLDDEEKEMIYSVIRFGDTLAREVMIPRIDIVALDINATLHEALDVIISGGHSRIPVYRDTVDSIEGVLYAKDLLKVWRSGETPESLQNLLREPYFIPETKKASELLLELQDRKTHLVIVVDEYGGTAGLLTIEDLIEEIVGEIQDEYDIHEEALYEQIQEDEYIFNARIDLDDLNHLLDSSVPTDESDTLGGYIFSKLGRVPSVGDTFVDYHLEFQVLSVTGRRIRKVHIKKLDTPDTDEANDTPGQHRKSSENSNHKSVPPSTQPASVGQDTVPDTHSLNLR